METTTSYWLYICLNCHFPTNHVFKIRKHIEECHKNVNTSAFVKKCSLCTFRDQSEVNIFRHYLLEHKKYKKCFKCDKLLVNQKRLLQHLLEKHKVDEFHAPIKDFCEHDNIFNRVLIRRLNFDPGEEPSIEFLMYIKYRKKIKEELSRMIQRHNYVKVMFIAHCYFEKLDIDGSVLDNCVIKLTSGCLTPFTQFDLHHTKRFINDKMQTIISNKDKVELVGSGLVMKYITNFDIRFAVPTLMGGCKRRGDLLKIKNFALAQKSLVDVAPPTSQQCFLYAVAAAKIIQTNPDLATNIPALKLLCKTYVQTNFKTKGFKSKFSYPFHIKHCKRFESYVKHLGIAFNVWTIFDNSVFTLYQSKADWKIPRIDLFLYQSNSMDAIGHYVAISNTNKFLRAVKVYCFKERNVQIGRKTYYCDKCTCCFTSLRYLKSHMYRCKNPKGQKIQYAKPGEFVSFDSNSRRQCKSPFIGFLDFEAKMENVANEQNYNRTKCENCRVGGPVRHCNHSERELAEQLPMTYSFYVFSTDGKMLFDRTYSSDENVMADFFNTLSVCEEKLEDLGNVYKKLHWSQRLDKLFNDELECWICKNYFVPGDTKYRAVPDHCHLTPPTFNESEQCLESKYLGAAHAICNLQRQSPKFFPVYVHNFMSYDSNFILKHMQDIDSNRIKCMPYNSNKLRTLSIEKWKFLDSFQMLSGGLADLVNNLSQDVKVFNLVKQGLKLTDSQVELCTKKAAYPYEWVESAAQLKLAQTYPPHSAFFSRLKGENISLDKYNEGKEIFDKFHFNNMLEYTEFYCKLDTLLLAEVIFSFRKTIYDSFQLAIENFISLPQLSFDACLKTLGSQGIEKMADPTMVTMLEQNIRGGVSFVNNRHETIQDPNNESMLYIDANNLYGWAQKMPLPISDYAWVPSNKHKLLKWKAMKAEQHVGYIAEVDINFPPHIHKMLDNLPLAPQHTDLCYKDLSPYSRKVQKNFLGKKQAKRYKQSKLVTNLCPKKRYVVHYLNLKLYIQLGAQITKVHNVMSFTQSSILKPYIEFLSDMRAKAKTKFAVNLWKLLANSLYGKFIQDVRKYCSVKFIDDEETLGKMLNNVYFKEVSKINEDYCLVLMQNSSITLDRLYGIGFTILELSKLLMYETWYNFIKPKFGDTATLILTDTDSFVIKFDRHSKKEALKLLAPIMDFSNFPPDSEFYNDSRKKVPGFFKDEYPTGLIKEAVNIRSKCYFLDIEPDPNFSSPQNKSSHIVCKGISHNVSSKFPIELYKHCIYSDNTKVYSTMHRIRARKRKLATVSITKQTLSSGDDKRFQTCSIHSLPYGSLYRKIKIKKCIKCIWAKRNK